MTNAFFEKRLKEGFTELQIALDDDKIYLRSHPIASATKVVSLLGLAYIRYIKAYNLLVEAHDGLLHPNKRADVKNIIEHVIARILEIKHEMVDVERSDFQFLDNIIIKNQLSKKSAEIAIPKYYRTERIRVLEALNERIDKVRALRDDPEKLKSLLSLASTVKRSSARTSKVSKSSRTSRERVSRISGTYSEVKGSVRTSDTEQIDVKSVVAEVAGKRPAVKTSIVHVYEFEKQIKMVQKYERARIGRLRYLQDYELYRMRNDVNYILFMPISNDVKLKCVLAIQKFWRRYRLRRTIEYKQRRQDELKGLNYLSFRDKTDLEAVKKINIDRRRLQLELEDAMTEAAVVTRIHLDMDYADEIFEDIIDELRWFVRVWYDTTHSWLIRGFPEFPFWPNDEPIIPPYGYLGVPEKCPKEFAREWFVDVVNTLTGHVLPPLVGSAVIVAGHWIPLDIYVPCMDLIRKKEVKAEPKDMTQIKAKEAMALKEKEKRERELAEKILEELRREGHVPEESHFHDELKVHIAEFKRHWYEGEDIKNNVKQGHKACYLKEDFAYEMQIGERIRADELMREDVNRLHVALVKDIPIRTMEEREKPPVKKEKTKKKKKKKKRDITGTTKITTLFDRLVSQDIIEKCEELEVNSLPGEYSYRAMEERRNSVEPTHCAADVYQVAKEFIAFPLVSPTVRASKLPSYKSILLVGPTHYTTPLVHALCHQTGSVLFHLRALGCSQKYKMKMLIHLLYKVPKAYEPSIIFVEGAEKPFYKKVPKVERPLKPGFLKRIIPKIIKNIKKEDKMIVIGTAERPWESRAGFAKQYKKILVFPEYDYHSVATFCQEVILGYHNIDRNFMYGIPARIYKGMPFPELEERFREILKFDRLRSLKVNPLTIEELRVIEMDPTKKTPTEDWYRATYPMCAEREEAMQKEREMRAREARLKDQANRRKAMANK